MTLKAPLLITGPTASGKSAYALARAALEPSVIINADSMQVYRDLAIVTARPSMEDEARTPHALYGFVDGRDAYSAGRYVADMAGVLATSEAAGLRPIIVGGTGLYFMALLEGLSPVPPIPPEVREHWRALAKAHGTYALYTVLWDRDPVMAARLDPNDAQRIVRALEVVDATGRSLSQWQQTPGQPLLEAATCEKIVVMPDRATLYARADTRFDAMVTGGGLVEVAALQARALDPALPVMRALGVPHLMQHGRGELGLDAAVTAAKTATRHYIKRQQVWIKRHMMAWNYQNT